MRRTAKYPFHSFLIIHCSWHAQCLQEMKASFTTYLEASLVAELDLRLHRKFSLELMLQIQQLYLSGRKKSFKAQNCVNSSTFQPTAYVISANTP